jgi:ketosteroid isomerase-like protein
MSPTATEDDTATLRRLVDERAVERALSEYFDRIDANDPVGASRFFAEDVEVEIMTGKRYSGRDRFARAVGRVLDGYQLTSHHLSNTCVDVDGDTAFSLAYVYAFHRLTEGGPPWHLWARIEDRWVRTPEGWLVTEHVLRGLDSQPDRDVIDPAWYVPHRGRLDREPAPPRPKA